MKISPERLRELIDESLYDGSVSELHGSDLGLVTVVGNLDLYELAEMLEGEL